MPLKKERLKTKILSISKECRKFEGNGNEAQEYFADKLSEAIIEEIEQLQIDYISGLSAPNGAVIGSINATIS